MSVSPPTSTQRAASAAVGGAPPPLREAPPEWAVERWVKKVGKVPGAAGRFLDGLVKVPVVGWVVRFFSSVWVGIAVLVLLGAYIAIGSGFAKLRAVLEVTDLQFFNAWPMRVLLALLALDLITVTLRRIPMTLFKLGSWTVHIGILTTITGCIIYFSQKEEGSARIYLNQTVTHCYDVTERALYAFPMKSDGTFDIDNPVITPIPALPIYYEHLAERGNGLNITLPESALPGKAARVNVKGYYPAAILQETDFRAGRPGEKGMGPAIIFGMTAGRTRQDRWMLAEPIRARVWEPDLPFAVEYLRQPPAKRIAELSASFDGPLGLTVRIPKLNIDRTLAIRQGAAIAIEGSPYTLTPGELGANNMVSKGYEGARSTTLSVAVSRKEEGKPAFEFERVCLSRFPERSPDFLKGERKQEGVDPDIEIIFHDARNTQIWIVEAADGSTSAIVRSPEGKSTTVPIGETLIPVPAKGLDGLQMQVKSRVENAVAVLTPLEFPEEQRKRGQTAMEAIQFSVIDVEVAATVNGKAWSVPHLYVPFSAYAAVGAPPVGKPPTVVELPDGKVVGLLLSTTRRELPAAVTLTDFEAVKYPGAVRTYADYRSTLRITDRDGGNERTVLTHLNHPGSDLGLYYFQAAWDGDDNALPEKRFSVVGVANRPGIPVMIVGTVLMMLGVMYAFYGKPILLRKKKEELAAWAAARKDERGK